MVTVVEAPPEPATGTEASQPAAKHSRGGVLRGALRRTAAIGAAALVVVVICIALFAVYEGPIAKEWYQIRQRQLAAEFKASRPHNRPGDAFALLQVPSRGMNVLVAQGDAPQQLRGGPGHRIGTPVPGAIGNSVIVGHARGWGGPFSQLGSLHTGDLIAVKTQDPNNGPQIAVFRVQSTRTTSSSDSSPFAPATDRRLTLITGTGGWSSERRLVVTAVSGTTGKVGSADGVRTTTEAGSLVLNAQVLVAALGLAGALMIVLVLRRRYHIGVLLAAATPLALLGLFGLLMNADLLLLPLR